MIARIIKVRNLLENTEGGDFFVKGGELFLAGNEMEHNMRVRDGKMFRYDCDRVEVCVVSGHRLRRELGKTGKKR